MKDGRFTNGVGSGWCELGDGRCGYAYLPKVVGASLIFFIAGGIGMTAMAVFSGKMDNSSRSSWIEQFTNLTAQLMFLLGILFIVWKP